MKKSTVTPVRSIRLYHEPDATVWSGGWLDFTRQEDDRIIPAVVHLHDCSNGPPLLPDMVRLSPCRFLPVDNPA
jgi:hypothetical protein